MGFFLEHFIHLVGDGLYSKIGSFNREDNKRF